MFVFYKSEVLSWIKNILSILHIKNGLLCLSPILHINDTNKIVTDLISLEQERRLVLYKFNTFNKKTIYLKTFDFFFERNKICNDVKNVIYGFIVSAFCCLSFILAPPQFINNIYSRT